MPDPYFSEIKYLGGGSEDFIEIAVDAGTDPSTIQFVVYHPNGTVRTTNDIGLTPTATEHGKDIYVIRSSNSATFNGIHKNGSLALIENGSVVQYVAFQGNNFTPATEGPADGLTPQEIGPANTAGSSVEATGTDGSSYAFQASPTEGAIPCFASGTRIKTPSGAVKVEDLSPGNLVLTLDHGARPILWVGQREIDLAQNPDLAPIRLPRDCLGRNRPHRDLLISPNHRVLVHPQGGEASFGSSELLIPAKHLIGLNAISQEPAEGLVTYVHLLLERHEVLISNGLPSESFNPCLGGLDAFGADRATRAETLALFPELESDPASYPAARPCLRRYEAGLAREMLSRGLA